jgi:hypothetical protein
LTPRRQNTKRIDVKLSGAALASFVCSLIALACFVPGLIAIIEPSVLDPRSDLVNNIACVSILASGLGMLFAITAFVYISISGGRVAGRGFAAIGAVIPPFLIFALFWHNIGRWYASTPPSLVCGTNLSGLGKAMLIYSQDYDNKLPMAAGHGAQSVARSPWWAADNREDAYGLANSNDTNGRASISASLYLLVKYAEVMPKQFVCKGDYGTTEFKPVEYGAGNRDLIDLWDFGPNPPIHCSYSYHTPYGAYPLTTSSEPGMAVAADRNPWIASPFKKARDFEAFDPDGGRQAERAGNALAHEEDGQNVLFLDSHVGFEKRSTCGINDDNIYTYWDDKNVRRGVPPSLSSEPKDRLDSLLVNDPALPR